MNPQELLDADLTTMPENDLVFLTWKAKWMLEQHDYQQIPPGDLWTIWLFLAGRGAGKTRTAAETIGQWSWEQPGTRGLVTAPTYNDLTKVAFEGESGLMEKIPHRLIKTYNKSEVQIELINGSLIQGISAEKPERFRGPQFHHAWADELGAWPYATEAFDMMMFGLRLGKHPRLIITTTPRPIPLLRKLLAREGMDVTVTRASTYANIKNLAPTMQAQLLQYEGTLLGRQEIHGELLDPEEQGIIRRSWFKMWPAKDKLPVFEFIILSLDTAFTEAARDKKSGKTDPTACSVWGLFLDNEKPRIMLLECWEEKLGFPDLLKRIPKEMSYTYGEQQEPLIKSNWGKPLISAATGGRKPDLLIIEDKGSGISLRQSLELEGIFAYAYNPGRAKKVERLHTVSHIFAHGCVFVPEGKYTDPNTNKEVHTGQFAKWAEALISQVCSFSGEGTTEHDDYVDTTSQAIRYFVDRNFITVTPQEKRDNDDDDDDESSRPWDNPYAK